MIVVVCAVLAALLPSISISQPTVATNVKSIVHDTSESAFWSNVVTKKPPTFDHANIPDIVVVIPSMRRCAKDGTPAPDKYLKPLVESIVGSLTPELKPHVSIMLMNVDKKPSEHAELLNLLNLPNVTLATRPPEDKAEVLKLVKKNDNGLFVDSSGREFSETTLMWRAGETRDVSHLLTQAMPRAPYVLMLEDDVLATSDVMPKIFQFLDQMKHHGRSEFFMADLYTPDISWGSQVANNLQRYQYECCTQAMLFNSRRIPELVAYELAHPQNPLDDNIRDFVKQDPNGRAIYAMVPNPFEHVGAYSSNPDKSTGRVEHRSLEFIP